MHGHIDLYRELPALLGGGLGRRDVVEQGGVIARLSAAFEPFVEAELARAVAEHAPSRVLDVGCGAGLQLAGVLEAAPAASGVGVEVDADALDLAERTLSQRGLADRASVIRADVREAAAAGHLAGPFDLAVLANVIYDVPVSERPALLRTLAVCWPRAACCSS